VHVCVCVCVCMHVHICVCVCVSMHVRVCVCVCVCVRACNSNTYKLAHTVLELQTMKKNLPLSSVPLHTQNACTVSQNAHYHFFITVLTHFLPTKLCTIYLYKHFQSQNNRKIHAHSKHVAGRNQLPPLPMFVEREQ
jgi:hypothetical protein